MPVRKAIIPAAGLGTRALPASKVVPKVLLPVVDKPAIQYTVEECARAGIGDVCIVVSPNDRLVPEHFARSPELEGALKRSGKDDLLELVRAVSDLARVTAIVQTEPLGLGHAVMTGAEYAGSEPVAVLLPDEIYDPNESFLRGLVESYEEEQTSVIAVTEVPDDQISLYGSIEVRGEPGELVSVASVVEKPAPSDAPSNLAVIGRYVLHPEAFAALAETGPGAGGEIQLTDALDLLARKGRLRALAYKGRRWDVGRKDGYLEATVSLAAEREDLGPAFRRFLDEFRP